MGREVRRVPKDWQHPRRPDGRYIPLFDANFERVAAEWDAEKAAWDRGEFPSWADEENKKLSFEEWNGDRPKAEDYMPRWPDHERTHLQMYECTTEGTPISPVFETPEEVARYCADHGVSAFGDQTASYEGWLRVARGGYAPSAVQVVGGPLVSGVEALTEDR